MQSNHITLIVLALLSLGIALAVIIEPATPLAVDQQAKALAPVESLTDPLPSAQAQQAQATIEVVFALDTTGSMGGLISGAKQKIWSIINDLKQGQPQPHLRIGLVGYRDRGDAYVTRLTAALRRH
jgi:Mg-chelatase subunit ChlD